MDSGGFGWILVDSGGFGSFHVLVLTIILQTIDVMLIGR